MIGQVAGVTKTNGQPHRSLLDEGVLSTYRTLLRRIGWLQLNGAPSHSETTDARPELRCLGITSSSRRQGVTTVGWQIAAASAELTEGSILLVDANPRHANVHRIFGIPQGPGLAEALRSPEMLEDSVCPIEGRNLSILPIGNDTSECRKTLDSPAIDEVVELLRPHHDLIVFDMPPATEANPGLRLAETLDGVLLVLESERVSMDAARHSRQILEWNGAPVLGVVLNKERNQRWAR